MGQICDFCEAPIPEGIHYGQFLFNIENMQNDTVRVESSKAIFTLCLRCAHHFNNFERAKQLFAIYTNAN